MLHRSSIEPILGWAWLPMGVQWITRRAPGRGRSGGAWKRRLLSGAGCSFARAPPLLPSLAEPNLTSLQQTVEEATPTIEIRTCYNFLITSAQSAPSCFPSVATFSFRPTLLFLLYTLPGGLWPSGLVENSTAKPCSCDYLQYLQQSVSKRTCSHPTRPLPAFLTQDQQGKASHVPLFPWLPCRAATAPHPSLLALPSQA
jgi:hypothetical protein